MSARRLRRRLDAAHEQGYQDAHLSRRRDPTRVTGDIDHRYIRWAYLEGYREAEARLRQTRADSAPAPLAPPQPGVPELDLLAAEPHGILDLLFPRRRR